jgi:hypothetical protein
MGSDEEPAGVGKGEAAVSSPAAEDPILRLALALHHGRGAYALLLGSGISRSAGIPTGWEIVLDLIHELAAGAGEPCEPGSEEAWYVERFGSKPTYDRLLDEVTGFKVERAQLLASYIEPTADGRAEGTKVPQEAHRAIARLVREGYIRVIITTNFDQLLEEALRAESIVPRVVSTPEAVEQALPLTQERCTIIKVHGDYTSGELKNTTEELAEYDARLNRLLERVFGDFGLIVCGWSGEWDRALRAVLKESSSRAYSTFWAARGQIGDEAIAVLNSRRGKALINIDDADSFFQVLEEKVTAIREVLNSETLTAEIARATLERYLARPHENRIRIHNLVTAEVTKVLGWLEAHIYLPSSQRTAAQLKEQLAELVRVLQPSLAMFIANGRWGDVQEQDGFIESLDRILDAAANRDYGLRWAGYWAYTEYLLLYAGGVAAVLGGRYDILYGLLHTPTAQEFIGRPRVPLTWALSKNSYQNLGHELRQVRPNSLEYTPLSNQLHDDLWPQFRSLPIGEARFEDTFDRFEYLLALVFRDLARRRGDTKSWVPAGRFSSRWHYGSEEGIVPEIGREIESQQGAWPPLQAGFFDRDFERLNELRQTVNEFIGTVQLGRL